MGISVNTDIVKEPVDLHQKIDLHHNMGISVNSDIAETVDLHQKIDLHHDMDIYVNSDIAKNH